MRIETNDSRLPSRDDCVLRYLLCRHSIERPNKPFLRIPGEAEISYSEFRHQVERVAAGLAFLGVRQGDMVATWLPNCADAVRIWFAINWLGAVNVPINTAYKGQLLAHVLNDCKAAVLISDCDLLCQLDGLNLPKLKTVVSCGDSELTGREAWATVPYSVLENQSENAPSLVRPIEPWDVQCIMYTSGTTGPSKGVITSYAHLAATGDEAGLPMVSEDDILMAAGPLFHNSGVMPIYAMLLRGSTSVLLPMFSTKAFWDQVTETGTTIAILLGVMTSFLTREPPTRKDRDHTLRKAIFVPVPDDWAAFAERFGVASHTCFNMSETSMPILGKVDPEVRGSCGRLRQGIEARVVDHHDRELPHGQVGELILRSDAPWSMNSGYLGNPEASFRAWRNGWFHTGDAFRRDDDGNYFFVDRLKDAIRRRGENISSYEVEREVLTHPDIRECAVYAVPSEHGEDEVMVSVAARAGVSLDPIRIHEFVVDRLAHFMVPRYIRVMDDLPRTPSQKVKKDILRSQGVTPDSWDREREGIRLRRQVLRS